MPVRDADIPIQSGSSSINNNTQRAQEAALNLKKIRSITRLQMVKPREAICRIVDNAEVNSIVAKQNALSYTDAIDRHRGLKSIEQLN